MSDPAQQRLLATLHSDVRGIAAADTGSVSFTRASLAVVSEATMAFIENLTTDVALFAKHAKRTKVNTSDVLLTARKNDSILEILTQYAETIGDTSVKRKTTDNSKSTKRTKKRMNDDDEQIDALDDAEEEQEDGVTNGATKTTSSKQKKTQNNNNDDADDDDNNNNANRDDFEDDDDRTNANRSNKQRQRDPDDDVDDK